MGEPFGDRGSSLADLKGRAVRGAAARVASRTGCAVLQLLGGVVLARLLLPEDFGLVAMVTAYMIVLSDIPEMGVTQALVQADDVTHERVSWLFWITTTLSVVVALLFVALSPVLVWFYDEPRLQPIALALAFGFVLRSLSAPHLGLLNRSMDFIRVAALDLAAVAISVVTAIAMAWSGWGLWALVARRLVVFAVTTVGAWALSPWRPGLHFMVPGSAPLVRFGVHSLGAQGLMSVRQNIDKMLLGWQAGAVPLGLYDRAQQLFVLPFNQVTSPLATVAVSTLSRLRSDRGRYHRYFLEVVEVIAFAGMGFGALLAVSADDVVVMLLGAQWSSSGPILAAFAPGIGFLLLSSTQNWLHLSLGRADRLFRWNAVVLTTTVLLLAVGARFGPVGVALAHTAALLLLFAPGYRYAGRPIDLGLSAILSVLWRYPVSAGAAWTTSWILLDRTELAGVYAGLPLLLRLLTSAGLCLVLYLAWTVVLHGGLAPLSKVLALLRELYPSRSSWFRLPGRARNPA